jgi:VanZ family protein
LRLAHSERGNRYDDSAAWIPAGDGHFSRIEHFFCFLACGMVLSVQWPKPKLALYAAGITFCAALEVVQIWIPGRHARLSDFLLDACATALGITLVRILQSIRSFLGVAVSA